MKHTLYSQCMLFTSITVFEISKDQHIGKEVLPRHTSKSYGRVCIFYTKGRHTNSLHFKECRFTSPCGLLIPHTSKERHQNLQKYTQ